MSKAEALPTQRSTFHLKKKEEKEEKEEKDKLPVVQRHCWT